MGKRYFASRSRGGFTLIELMIVVAIIGVLAAIALPKFGELVRKSSEGAAKGNLGSIRSALFVYYGDIEGQYPSDLVSLTLNSKYLGAIPVSKEPNYHQDSSLIVQAASTSNDGGGWVYNNIYLDPYIGSVMVNCTHTDSKGTVWTTY